MPNLNFSFGFKFDNSAVKVFNQNLTQVNKTVRSTTDAVKDLNGKVDLFTKIQKWSAISTIVTNSVSMLKGLAAGFEKAAGWAGEYAERGDKIAKTSRLVGLSVKEFQALDSAARHAGMSSEEMVAEFRRRNTPSPTGKGR